MKKLVVVLIALWVTPAVVGSQEEPRTPEKKRKSSSLNSQPAKKLAILSEDEEAPMLPIIPSTWIPATEQAAESYAYNEIKNNRTEQSVRKNPFLNTAAKNIIINAFPGAWYRIHSENFNQLHQDIESLKDHPSRCATTNPVKPLTFLSARCIWQSFCPEDIETFFSRVPLHVQQTIEAITTIDSLKNRFHCLNQSVASQQWKKKLGVLKHELTILEDNIKNGLPRRRQLKTIPFNLPSQDEAHDTQDALPVADHDILAD